MSGSRAREPLNNMLVRKQILIEALAAKLNI